MDMDCDIPPETSKISDSANSQEKQNKDRRGEKTEPSSSKCAVLDEIMTASPIRRASPRKKMNER